MLGVTWSGNIFESTSYKLRVVDTGGSLIGSSASYKLSGVHEASSLLGSSSSYRAAVDRARIIDTTEGLLVALTCVMGADPNPLMVEQVSTVYASITYDEGGGVFSGTGVYINGYAATYDSVNQWFYVKFTKSIPGSSSFSVTDITDNDVGRFSTDSVSVQWNPLSPSGPSGGGSQSDLPVQVISEAIAGPLERLAAMLGIPVAVLQLGIAGLVMVAIAAPIARARKKRTKESQRRRSERLRSKSEKQNRKRRDKAERENKKARFEADWELED